MKHIIASRKHMSRSYCMAEKAQKRDEMIIRIFTYAMLIGLAQAIIKSFF